MLDNVEWGEFNLQELFGKSTRGTRLKSADIIKGKLPFVTAGETNEGISDFIGNDVTVFSENTTTIDMFGSAKYRSYDYGGDDHIAVVHTEKLSKQASVFITSAIHRVSYTGEFHYGKNFYAKDADALNIRLPTKDNKPDFDFMECFILQLERERLQKLDAYLSATGLDNYELTKAEQQALIDFENGDIEWEEFKIGNLFKKLSTKKLPFKADELLKEPKGTYNLPCLTSSFKNQGLNYFAPRDNTTILKNVISIPSNSDVYRAYFQSMEFTVLSDAYALDWIFDDVEIQSGQYLFAVQCINKVTDLSIYSYKNKLGGWNVVKNKHIQLPINDEKPNYEFIQNLMSAIQKQIIRGVIEYNEEILSK